MDKDDRRVKFHKKEHYHQKERMEKVQKEELTEDLLNKLAFINPDQLLEFMQNDYEDFIKKHDTNAHKIGKIIFNQLLKMREDWLGEFKDELMKLLERENIEKVEDIFKKIMQDKKPLYKPGFSIWREQIKDLTYFKVICFIKGGSHQVKSCHYFLIADEAKKLMNWQLQNKRFKKDIIFYCSQLKDIQNEVVSVQNNKNMVNQ